MLKALLYILNPFLNTDRAFTVKHWNVLNILQNLSIGFWPPIVGPTETGSLKHTNSVSISACEAWPVDAHFIGVGTRTDACVAAEGFVQVLGAGVYCVEYSKGASTQERAEVSIRAFDFVEEGRMNGSQLQYFSYQVRSHTIC